MNKNNKKTKQRKKTSVYLILCGIYPGKKHNQSPSEVTRLNLTWDNGWCTSLVITKRNTTVLIDRNRKIDQYHLYQVRNYTIVAKMKRKWTKLREMKIEIKRWELESTKCSKIIPIQKKKNILLTWGEHRKLK